MRPLRRSRISSRFWNNLCEIALGVLVSYFLSAKAISFKFASLPSYLYLLILLLAFIYSFRKKKYWLLLGMGMGSLFGASLLLRISQTPLDEYEGIVIEAKKNYFIFLSNGRRYYVYLSNHDYYFGDLIKIKGEVSEFITTKYEGYFDFENYLENKGVDYQLDIIDISSIFSVFPFRKVEKAFLANFDSETASLIDTTLFSYRDSKDSLLSSSNSLGIYSELSNGGVILSAYLRFFEPIIQRHVSSFRWQKAIKLFLIFSFLLLSPTKIGVIKLFLMNLSYVIFPNEKIRYEHRLIALAVIILLFDRWAILSSGFFYGFGLSFTFLLSRRMLDKGRKEFVKKIRRKALLEAFIFPSSVSNGKIALLGPLFRILALPLILPFIFLSLASFLIAPFTHLLPWYANIIRSVLTAFCYAEVSIPWVGNNSETIVALLYLILLICLYFFDVGLHYFAYRTIKLTGLVMILNAIPFQNFFSQEVTFINVGQGDAILIRDRLKTVMIDTGGVLSFDIGTEVDIPYLYRKRIYHLDYLITTHDDHDHSGGVESMQKNFDIDHYLASADSFPLTIGDIHLENLNVYGGEGNDASLVLYMKFIDKSFLFMGDASQTVEKKIIADNPNLKADILKVGHHGSNTSTSLAFIKAIEPKEAVISVGRKNYYGHPAEETLKTLSLYNVKIRRTDEEGSITYWANCL